MRLRQKRNALQLSVFFFFFSFFCQPYPGLQSCKSVLLILKISQYGRSRQTAHLFPSIHARIDIKLDVSISIISMTTNLVYRNNYKNRVKWDQSSRCSPLHPVMITWQTKSIISPRLWCLWPPNLKKDNFPLLTFMGSCP